MSQICPKCHVPFIADDDVKVVALAKWHELNRPHMDKLYAIGRPHTITNVTHLYCPLQDENG